mmetsp:Transcript_8687/g.14735  ORF Transcript_8687/g.14735 Transcript_8687/m.14735 type:complete len:104 (-) Transcript_8687:477-788(-)
MDDSSHLSYQIEGTDQQRSFKELTLVEKVAQLTIIVRKAMNENPILLVLMFGASITRLLAVLFSTYLILWIQHFCTPEAHQESQSDFSSQHILECKERGKTTY